jgi:hypothetical protein
MALATLFAQRDPPKCYRPLVLRAPGMLAVAAFALVLIALLEVAAHKLPLASKGNESLLGTAIRRRDLDLQSLPAPLEEAQPFPRSIARLFERAPQVATTINAITTTSPTVSRSSSSPAPQITGQPNPDAFLPEILTLSSSSSASRSSSRSLSSSSFG